MQQVSYTEIGINEKDENTMVNMRSVKINKRA
jgi:hypothetical protein